jgi:hypothetical protein
LGRRNSLASIRLAGVLGRCRIAVKTTAPEKAVRKPDGEHEVRLGAARIATILNTSKAFCPSFAKRLSKNVIQREPCIPSPAILTTYKRSSCILSIFTAIQAVRFAARLDACIRSTVPRMAASGSCEATMLCPGIEFRRDVRPPVIQGIAMVSPVVTPIACSCPLLNETL